MDLVHVHSELMDLSWLGIHSSMSLQILFICLYSIPIFTDFTSKPGFTYVLLRFSLDVASNLELDKLGKLQVDIIT